MVVENSLNPFEVREVLQATCYLNACTLLRLNPFEVREVLQDAYLKPSIN